MPYVDTHCHLDHHFDLSVATQVARARRADVTTMITVGTDMATSTQAVATAQRHDGVYAVVGVHPNDAMEATPQVLDVISRLATEPNVVGIGETGLDYHRDHTTPRQQESAFRAHIDLAIEHDRTLVIHCREAWDDLLKILEAHGAPDRVVMHCFSGDAEVVHRCVEKGWYVSFAGNLTFANAQPLRDAAAVAPLELTLTETDSPYLTPHPHRGEANDPSYVAYTLRALAEIHDRPVDQVADAVLVAATRAFDLPPVEAPEPA